MKYENLIKRLISSLKCNGCGSQYEIDNVDILGHQDELWFLSVFCPSCESQGLVAAVIKEEREGESGSMLDFTGDEYTRFANMEPIDLDEVLDMHIFLSNFDGDFARVFEKQDS